MGQHLVEIGLRLTVLLTLPILVGAGAGLAFIWYKNKWR